MTCYCYFLPTLPQLPCTKSSDYNAAGCHNLFHCFVMTSSVSLQLRRYCIQALQASESHECHSSHSAVFAQRTTGICAFSVADLCSNTVTVRCVMIAVNTN